MALKLDRRAIRLINRTHQLSIGPRGVAAQLTSRANLICSDINPRGLAMVQSGTPYWGDARVIEALLLEISLDVLSEVLFEERSSTNAGEIVGGDKLSRNVGLLPCVGVMKGCTVMLDAVKVVPL